MRVLLLFFLLFAFLLNAEEEKNDKVNPLLMYAKFGLGNSNVLPSATVELCCRYIIKNNHGVGISVRTQIGDFFFECNEVNSMKTEYLYYTHPQNNASMVLSCGGSLNRYKGKSSSPAIFYPVPDKEVEYTFLGFDCSIGGEFRRTKTVKIISSLNLKIPTYFLTKRNIDKLAPVLTLSVGLGY